VEGLRVCTSVEFRKGRWLNARQGGYTVLASVVNKPTFYAAGTSLYGVSDLKLLAEFTHKFESRYLDGLIGGTVEEVPDLYKERSPITHASNIRSPLLVSDGLPLRAMLMVVVDSPGFRRQGGPAQPSKDDSESH
jgi:hypothetical protein